MKHKLLILSIAGCLLAPDAWTKEQQWESGTLVDYTEEIGTRGFGEPASFKEKKIFTFSITFSDGITRVYRKVASSMFDTTPYVVVGTAIRAQSQNKNATTVDIMDHNGKKHRSKFVKAISAPKAQ